MRTVYAVQFEVNPLPNQTADVCFSDLKQRLAEWVEQKYLRAFRIRVKIAFDGTLQVPKADHEVIGSSKNSRDWQHCGLVWTHPGDRDASLLWCIESEIARMQTTLQFSLRIRISSRKPIVKPLVFDLGKPHIVSNIIKAYPCSIDGQPIIRTPIKIGITRTTAFVDEQIRNRKRLLPVVVLTPDRFSEKPLVDPKQLQDDLIGFATVAVPESKWAAFEFSDSIGRDYTCYDGAARIYWPGFDFDANPWDHPLYLPQRIRDIEAEGRSFGKYLFQMLSSIASFRFREGQTIRAVRWEMEAETQAESERLRSQVRMGRVETDQLMEELEKSWKLIDELQRERTQLRSRVGELEDEVEQTKDNLARVYEYKKREEAQDKELAAKEQASRDYRNVSEALEAAEIEFENQLTVWDCAKRAAEDSGFRRPIEIYLALMAISDLCKKCRDAKKKNKAVGPWDRHFEQANLKYAHTESQTTLSKYGSDRKFTHEGETRQILKHLTIGGGSAIDCLQIYFDYDGETDHMIIAYCGPHLPFASQR